MKFLEFILRQATLDFLSPLHIVSLLGMALVVVLVVLLSSYNPKKVNESLINSLMGLAFIFFVFKYVMIIVSGTFSLTSGLPLAISDLIFMIMLIWSLLHSEFLSNFIYYFGILFLVIYSVFQVNIYPYFNIVYILDMLMVVMCLSSFIIFVRINKYVPKFKYFKTSVFLMIIGGGALYAIDSLLGSHYLYLDWFTKATPFNLLSDRLLFWGVYIVVGVSLLLWGCLLAIYFKRKAKIEAIYTVSDVYMKNIERRVK